MVSEKATMLSLPVLGELQYREWHALVDGFYVGYIDGEDNHDYTQEQHYWRAGYVAGDVINDRTS